MLKIVFPFTLSTTMLNLANYNLKTADGLIHIWKCHFECLKNKYTLLSTGNNLSMNK